MKVGIVETAGSDRRTPEHSGGSNTEYLNTECFESPISNGSAFEWLMSMYSGDLNNI